MGTCREGACCYRIVVRGECGDMLAAAIEGLAVQPLDGSTCVVACVQDESEFYGLLDRFQDFALHIISVTELGPAA